MLYPSDIWAFCWCNNSFFISNTRIKSLITIHSKSFCKDGSIAVTAWWYRGATPQCDAWFWVEPHQSVTLCHVKFSITSTEICMEKCHTLMWFNPKPSVIVRPILCRLYRIPDIHECSKNQAVRGFLNLIHYSNIQPNAFFSFILPPILIEAGYFMPRQAFSGRVSKIDQSDVEPHSISLKSRLSEYRFHSWIRSFWNNIELFYFSQFALRV